MVGYSLRCSKVIKEQKKNSLLPIEGEYAYDLLLGSLLKNLWLQWKWHEERLQVHE